MLMPGFVGLDWIGMNDIAIYIEPPFVECLERG